MTNGQGRSVSADPSKPTPPSVAEIAIAKELALRAHARLQPHNQYVNLAGKCGCARCAETAGEIASALAAARLAGAREALDLANAALAALIDISDNMNHTDHKSGGRFSWCGPCRARTALVEWGPVHDALSRLRSSSSEPAVKAVKAVKAVGNEKEKP